MVARPLAALVLVTILLAACASNRPGEAPAPATPVPSAPADTSAPATGDAGTPPAGGTACTMEAKRCADGTQVGRSGPRCDFAPCPEPKDCKSNADCDKDQICTGEAGCEKPLHCVKNVPCTRDLATYCGCDGTTFQGSGSCPTKPWKKRGAC